MQECTCRGRGGTTWSFYASLMRLGITQSSFMDGDDVDACGMEQLTLLILKFSEVEPTSTSILGHRIFPAPSSRRRSLLRSA